METVVKVLIDGASDDLTFSYTVPKGLSVVAGQRVRIPLRNRGAIGTVISVEDLDISSLPYELKPIGGLVSKDPFLTPGLMKLASWISSFYLTPIESVFRTMLPKPSRGESEKRKTEKVVSLSDSFSSAVLEGFSGRQVKQKKVLEYLSSNGTESLARLTGALGFSRSSIKALEDKSYAIVGERIVTRDPLAEVEYVESKPLNLNEEQAEVLKCVLASAREIETGGKVKPILLYGVTGSGKTEVYLQAIQKAIDAGKGAIVLVPEIALTPQTADRFKKRFAKIKDQVAILHSNLSEGERHDEWRKVLEQKARIVIGARSAIFSPITNLGLIVVDEEHENSYKQDISPRYQARDVAVVRGHLEKCPVLLGSATPSLESWSNTQNDKYELTIMSQRIDDRKMPLIRIIDMRQESRKAQAGPTILSHKLRQSIEERLSNGEQTILFLNRRGFAKNILCPECGYVANCRHCSTTMTLHRKEDRLVCHICGFSQLPPKSCPECSSKSIVNAGYGTERVEEVLKQVFDRARITRVDTDAMRRKNQLRDTLNDFRANKIDILIGTQMIAKGLHFPNVTLVGILNADVGLHIPDIRAGERTFQLLTQVAGRAGRGELEGEVVVQTYTPHHPSIQFARHHDFEGFADQELQMRRQFGHPPYLHLVLITARSVHQQRAEFSLKTLHARLAKGLPDDMRLTEPLPSPLVKSHDQWRYQVILKATSARKLAAYVSQVMRDLTFPSDVIVTVDVDPYSMG
ncbi:MAG: primosomal protein N' [Verrucomicrobiales bacterium]|jgi:primosomal protein N' (replication factor Y)|nr:primosomal protein N' [Verrucomicrobiales bacterium]|tara:strand:- start:11505 stop:13745 length:2241 start_codon:yes stop_codon:yes gene_type:complete